MFDFRTFTLAFFPQKDISAPSHTSFLAVWVAVHLHWKGTESEAKWNDSELAESYSLRALACKEMGPLCNMPQDLELVGW